MKKAGNDKLFQLTEQQIYMGGKICSDHFEDECFKNKYTLNTGAIPTLCIPGRYYNIIGYFFFKIDFLLYRKLDTGGTCFKNAYRSAI